MHTGKPKRVAESSFEILSEALHHAIQEASASLARWIERPTSVSIDSIQRIPLQDAPQVLGEDETPIFCCTAEIEGRLAGELILAFDHSSGLALADLLLNRPSGTSTEWNDLEKSAALETANIVSCAYLNALSRILPKNAEQANLLLPSPPTLRRDFAESVLQSALIGQAMAGDDLFVAHAGFQIEGAEVNWQLVFIPDAASMAELQRVRRDTNPSAEN